MNDLLNSCESFMDRLRDGGYECGSERWDLFCDSTAKIDSVNWRK
jgi:hypothetical protein